MNILITGGTGLIGKRLVLKLIEQMKQRDVNETTMNYEQRVRAYVERIKKSKDIKPDKDNITIFCRHEDTELSQKSDSIKFIYGNISDKEALDRAFQIKPDIVYHLAANMDESDQQMYSDNVVGTQNIVDLCKQHDVKQMIFMSSSGVLGETLIPAKETFPYNPTTLYEKSKMECEKIIIASEVPYTIIRTSIVLGPNNIWMTIFGAAKKKYPIIGSGKNYFHLVYVDDVVDILDFVKNNEKAKNQIFNIAAKDMLTYQEVYQMICDELKCEMTKKHIPIWFIKLATSMHQLSCKLQGKKPKLTMMKSSIDRLIRNRMISLEKVRGIGFEPKYDTRKAIKETIKYLGIARLGYTDQDLAEISKLK